MALSLQAADLEGLDEVRNAGWTAGRETPLAVGGPSGLRDVVAALNKAYELSDAQIFVEASPKGGFGAALLGVLPGYWVDYGGQRAVLQPCNMDLATRFNEIDAFTLACGEEAANTWPLQNAQYLVQGASAEP